jgi:predicted O-methyltransferase YrrM
LGEAQEQLDRLINEGETGKWDMIVIDGDHIHILNNWERALKLCRIGGVIAVLGTLWRG